jgi:hypothetical protein
MRNSSSIGASFSSFTPLSSHLYWLWQWAYRVLAVSASPRPIGQLAPATSPITVILALSTELTTAAAQTTIRRDKVVAHIKHASYVPSRRGHVLASSSLAGVYSAFVFSLQSQLFCCSVTLRGNIAPKHVWPSMEIWYILSPTSKSIQGLISNLKQQTFP